jgi:hypothetical protein
MRATDSLLPDTPANLWVIYNTVRGTVLHDSGLRKPWTTNNQRQADAFAKEYTDKSNERCVAVQVKEAIDLVIKHDRNRK